MKSVRTVIEYTPTNATSCGRGGVLYDGVTCEQFVDVLSRERSSEQVALARGSAEPADGRKLGICFDAFGRRGQMQRSGELQDAADDCVVAVAFAQTIHE